MGLGGVENHGNQAQEPQGQDKTHQSQCAVLVMDRNLPSPCKGGVRSVTVQPGLAQGGASAAGASLPGSCCTSGEQGQAAKRSRENQQVVPDVL